MHKFKDNKEEAITLIKSHSLIKMFYMLLPIYPEIIAVKSNLHEVKDVYISANYPGSDYKEMSSKDAEIFALHTRLVISTCEQIIDTYRI